MRSAVAFFFVFLFVVTATPVVAQEIERPEPVVEKMAFKLVRGVTNMATSIVELPKQTYLVVRDRGTIGYAVGPLKGIGMTLYRGFIGSVETAFFLVPQPGYYDSMIEPEFVWQGWEERGNEPLVSKGVQDSPAEGKRE